MYMLIVLGFLCFLYHYCLVIIFFLEGELLCGNIVEGCGTAVLEAGDCCLHLTPKCNL